MGIFGLIRHDDTGNADQGPVAPDLGTQLEDLLVSVWHEERMWRTEDRIDPALQLGAPWSDQV